MQDGTATSIAGAVVPVVVSLARLLLAYALKRRSRRKVRAQLRQLRDGLSPRGSASTWPAVAWDLSCAVCVALIDELLGDGTVRAAAAAIACPALAARLERAAAAYTEALARATSSRRRLAAAVLATVGVFRLALFHELLTELRGPVAYLGRPVSTFACPAAVLLPARAFRDAAAPLGLPSAACVVAHVDGALVLHAAEPELALCAVPPGTVLDARLDAAALGAMRLWRSNARAAESVTARHLGDAATLYLLHADEACFVAAVAHAGGLGPVLRALFRGEHALAVRAEAGRIVGVSFAPHAEALAAGALGAELAAALCDGAWRGEPCRAEVFEHEGARIALVSPHRKF